MKLNNRNPLNFYSKKKEWNNILIAGFIASLLPLLSELHPILIIFNFCTSIPLIFIGLKNDLESLIISSIIALSITLIITIKENMCMFLAFYVIPSIIIVYLSKLKQVNTYKTNKIIINLTIYGSIMGIISSIIFNKTITDLYYITENFAKKNGLETSYIIPWLSWIPAIFCIGNIIINVISVIIVQKFLIYKQYINSYFFEIKKIKLPDVLLILLTAACISSFVFKGQLEIISKTLIFTTSFPYLIYSFITLHLISDTMGNKKNLMLLIIYTVIILLIWPILIMVVISIFEPWIGLRKWTKQKLKGENQ